MACTTKNVLSRSDKLVIINDSGKPISIKKKPIIKEEVTKESPVTSISLPKKPLSPTPSIKEGYDYKFLMGKRLQKTLVDSDGRIIARENALVSQELIDRVRSAGKLVQLALYSL